VSANCFQENRYKLKKTSEKDIKKCDKSMTTRQSFKTTDRSKAQSVSSNGSQVIAVKEEINYDINDVMNESNVEECDGRETFAQPLNSTAIGSIRMS
jgi:hypothetical protein